MDIVDKMRVMADDVGGDLVWCDEAADTIEALRVTMLEECSKRGHLMAEAHELRKRIAELESDAARYRWLRQGCCDKDTAASRIAQNEYGMHWDAAIDAAMKS